MHIPDHHHPLIAFVLIAPVFGHRGVHPNNRRTLHSIGGFQRQYPGIFQQHHASAGHLPRERGMCVAPDVHVLAERTGPVGMLDVETRRREIALLLKAIIRR